MSAIKHLICILLFLFSSSIVDYTHFSHAAEQEWINLDCDEALESWQGDGRAWTLAGDAMQDPNEPKKLVTLPGTGVLVSLEEEKTPLSNLTSVNQYGDIDAHIEFMVPNGSNGGVKFQGLYEIQIRDSYGKENLSANECGGVYPRAEEKPRYHLIDDGVPPRTNATKPAGEWQTLDVEFRAPRFSSEGKKIENARFIKVVLNDQVIHENVELRWPTGHAWREKKEVALGPLYLQGDHGPHCLSQRSRTSN